jgi:hypothetical protein
VHLCSISVYIIVLIPTRFAASNAPSSGRISGVVSMKHTSQMVCHTWNCVVLPPRFQFSVSENYVLRKNRDDLSQCRG